jgi:hypothetical protein
MLRKRLKNDRNLKKNDKFRQKKGGKFASFCIFLPVKITMRW